MALLPIAGAGDVESVAWGMILGGGARIRSVQSSLSSIIDVYTTSDITISPVDLSRSFLVVRSIRGTGSGTYTPALGEVMGYFVDERTVRLQRESSSSGRPARAHVQVIELEGDVSVQAIQGVMNAGVTNHEIAIAPVDVSRTLVIISATNGRILDNYNDYIGNVPCAYLVSPSGLRVERGVGLDRSSYTVFVVEVK